MIPRQPNKLIYIALSKWLQEAYWGIWQQEKNCDTSSWIMSIDSIVDQHQIDMSLFKAHILDYRLNHMLWRGKHNNNKMNGTLIHSLFEHYR